MIIEEELMESALDGSKIEENMRLVRPESISLQVLNFDFDILKNICTEGAFLSLNAMFQEKKIKPKFVLFVKNHLWHIELYYDVVCFQLRHI